MDAIIVTGGTAEEIAALAVWLQERQGTDRNKKRKLPKYVVAFKDGRVVIEKRKRIE